MIMINDHDEYDDDCFDDNNVSGQGKSRNAREDVADFSKETSEEPWKEVQRADRVWPGEGSLSKIWFF